MAAFNLQAVRAFRLLRLLRLFKLVRYTNAVHRFHRAFEIARDDLVLFGVIALIVLYLSAIGIYHFEHEAQPERFSSVFDSLWWAVATLTTVGYGDIFRNRRRALFAFIVWCADSA
jgi:voltage-gated potassium channel